MRKAKDLLAAIREKQQRAEQLRAQLAGYEALRRELARIQEELRQISAILKGDTDNATDRPKSRHGFVGGKRAKPIQKGSSVWWTAKILFTRGQPMHIDHIIKRIEAESGERFKKATLVSNLSRYVKYGDTFNRPAPNTFGLIDFTKDPDPSELFALGFKVDEEDS